MLFGDKNFNILAPVAYNGIAFAVLVNLENKSLGGLYLEVMYLLRGREVGNGVGG